MNRVASYTIGFVCAMLLTAVAFATVYIQVGMLGSSEAQAWPLWQFVIIIALAFIQLFVQLYFFLHLGLQKEARWNTLMFVMTFSGLLIVVLASVWIMYHLNYNMTPQDMLKYIESQSGL